MLAVQLCGIDGSAITWIDRDHRLLAPPSGRARFFPAYRDAAVRFLWRLRAASAAELAITCLNLALIESLVETGCAMIL